MNRVLRGFTALAGSVLLTTAAPAAPRPAPRPVPVKAAPAPQPAESAPVITQTVAGDDQELPRLLDRLSALGEQIAKNAQAADVWRTQMDQTDLLLQLAARSKAEEQENWLRMAIDSGYSAAIQSPLEDATAAQRFAQMPGRIAHDFPSSPLFSYAALQGVQAEYVRNVGRDGEHPDKARQKLSVGLAVFARDYPKAPEAPKAILDAAQISESLGDTDDARACYRYLADHYAGQPAARKAGGALWRLGLAGEPVALALPFLFAPDSHQDSPFDLKDLRDKLVVVYFWSSASQGAEEDIQALKDLAVKNPDGDLEIVYVNMDADVEAARTFLAGRLTVGTHVYQRGGLDGPVAERYGIQTLPTTFLIGKDGTLIRQSIQVSELAAEVSARLPHGR